MRLRVIARLYHGLKAGVVDAAATTASRPLAAGPIASPAAAASLRALAAGGAAAAAAAAACLWPRAEARAEAPAAAAAAASAAAVSAAPAAAAGPEDPYVLPPPRGALPRDIVLYQYDACPFCCKVKAFLDAHRLPYRVVEVNPLTKAELRWSAYRKVPVVLLDGGEQVNDSSAIISRLAAELEAAGRPASARTLGGRRRGWLGLGRGARARGHGATPEEEAAWRRWVDARLVRVVTVNIYRTPREALATFDYIADGGNFSWAAREAARWVGAATMYAISGRLAKKYGVAGDPRAALAAAANEWVAAAAAAGGAAGPFMGGAAPGLADLAAYGVLRAVRGSDAFADAMAAAPGLAPWYDAVEAAVGEPARVR